MHVAKAISSIFYTTYASTVSHILTACTSMFPMIAFFTSPPGYIGPYPMLSLSPLRSFASLPLWPDHVPFLGM